MSDFPLATPRRETKINQAPNAYPSISSNSSSFTLIERINLFSAQLKNEDYEEATETYRTSSEAPYLIQIALDHLKERPEATVKCSLLFIEIVLPSTAQNSYGLATEMIRHGTPVFSAALIAYISIMEERKDSNDQIQEKLKENLSGLLTYREFTLEQAKVLIEQIPGFNPQNRANPKGHSQDTFTDQARTYNKRQDLIDHLESISPTLPSKSTQDIEIDYTQFSGVEELKNRPTEKIKRYETLTLTNDLGEVYDFLGKSPFIEGKQDFIENEITLCSKYNRLSPEEALTKVKASYSLYVDSYHVVKSSVLEEGFNIYLADELALDFSRSDGHTNIGSLDLNGKELMYKFSSTTLATFVDVRRELHFIKKCIALREIVPNVVEFSPSIILNRQANGNILIGYFMEIAPGKMLKNIPSITRAEKTAIERQFNQDTEAMLDSGYALYDFSDENVMLDGQILTFIDLSPAGFRAEALKEADTSRVQFRISEMLSRKVK
jgi:hypothetical protein